MTIRIRDWAFLTRLLLDPELAVGEAYMEGAVALEGGDVYDLLTLFYANLGFKTGLGIMRLGSILRRFKPKRRRSARANVAHHYDLSDALYERFLDSDRQYSCAYYTRDSDTLEAAQDNKKRHIAAKLCLTPGLRVLDVGSGWGGLALYLAQVASVSVTGVTLSAEQHVYSVRRAKDQGLDAHIDFRLEDFLEHEGRYDRLVSVGMLEHVGRLNYDAYFRKVSHSLQDGGIALIHTIGRADGPGPQNPWIDKYIFPGGYLPALSEIIPSIEKAGLYVTDIEILRLHYAQTLRDWRRNFGAKRDEIAGLYDERFCRMWEFYLAASEASFRRHGGLIVFQIQVSNRHDTVPLLRDYMVDWERARMALTVAP